VSAALFLLASVLGLAAGAGAALAEPPSLPASAALAAGRSALIDLNSASTSELESLPGIGHSRALAIVAFRETHGRFHSVSQLLRIKGIGRAMLRKLRPLVTVSAASEQG
jgi:competence protein ComEA